MWRVPAVGVAERASRVRPRWKYAWIWAAIWLAYLSQPVLDAWREPDPVHRWVGLATLLLFAATFIGAFAVMPRLTRNRESHLGGTILTLVTAVLAIAITTLLGEAQLPIFVYVAVLAMFMLPGRWGPVTVVGIIVATAIAQAVVPSWNPDYSVQFQIFVGGLAMWGVVQLITRNRELDEAHREIARLAVEEERNRFARDLHDILGHSLTVMAVKAELAGRMVRLDPDRAESEITEVERLSRSALAEVRTAVAGYRDVSLATELANARSALSAAGIDADLPTAIDDVPPDRRELFGWVVREGVTNVVRHSGASRPTVHITPSTVTISDNGRVFEPAGAPAGPETASTLESGHGLLGLRERAEALGGTIHIGQSASGFTLAVQV
jgi:two-component system, NarL family, sensor histidine kinase DesK